MALDMLVDATQLDSALTSVADAIRAKGGTSGSLAFPAGFVSAIGAIPTGGGSPLIASGTFTGGGAYTIDVAVGTSVPLKNMLFLAEVPAGEITNDANYKLVNYAYLYTGPDGFAKFGAYYNPSTSGGDIYTVDGTSLNFIGFSTRAIYVRNTTMGRYQGVYQGTGHQYRPTPSNKPTEIYFHIDAGNGNYKFISGVTYNWKLYYFGDDYENESLSI